jgi:hypothetical protein
MESCLARASNRKTSGSRRSPTRQYEATHGRVPYRGNGDADIDGLIIWDSNTRVNCFANVGGTMQVESFGNTVKALRTDI